MINLIKKLSLLVLFFFTSTSFAYLSWEEESKTSGITDGIEKHYLHGSKYLNIHNDNSRTLFDADTGIAYMILDQQKMYFKINVSKHEDANDIPGLKDGKGIDGESEAKLVKINKSSTIAGKKCHVYHQLSGVNLDLTESKSKQSHKIMDILCIYEGDPQYNAFIKKIKTSMSYDKNLAIHKGIVLWRKSKTRIGFSGRPPAGSRGRVNKDISIQQEINTTAKVNKINEEKFDKKLLELPKDYNSSDFAKGVEGLLLGTQ